MFEKLLLLIFLFSVLSCGGGDKSLSESVRSSSSDSGEDRDNQFSDNMIIYSQILNPIVGLPALRTEAEKLARNISSQPLEEGVKGAHALLDVIYLERLAFQKPEVMLRHLQKMAKLLKKAKIVEKELVIKGQMEIAFAAVQRNNPSMAQFIIGEIENSDAFKLTKNRELKANLLHLKSLMALAADQLPEAASLWKSALIEDKSHLAANLNLAFLNLKYTHFDQAQEIFERMSDFWIAKVGLVSANRLMGKISAASKLCKTLLSESEDSFPLLVNCGIHEWQSNKNKAKAKKYIQDALKVRDVPKELKDEAKNILAAIR